MQFISYSSVSSVAFHLLVKVTLSPVNKRLANYHTTIHWDFYIHILFSTIFLEVEEGEVDFHQLPNKLFSLENVSCLGWETGFTWLS